MIVKNFQGGYENRDRAKTSTRYVAETVVKGGAKVRCTCNSCRTVTSNMGFVQSAIIWMPECVAQGHPYNYRGMNPMF